VTIQWRSTDETVFKVEPTDSTGAAAKVIGLGSGNATLIVSAANLQKEIPVIIKESW
jgi:hypothetical protein